MVNLFVKRGKTWQYGGIVLNTGCGKGDVTHGKGATKTKGMGKHELQEPPPQWDVTHSKGAMKNKGMGKQELQEQPPQYCNIVKELNTFDCIIMEKVEFLRIVFTLEGRLGQIQGSCRDRLSKINAAAEAFTGIANGAACVRTRWNLCLVILYPSMFSFGLVKPVL